MVARPSKQSYNPLVVPEHAGVETCARRTYTSEMLIARTRNHRRSTGQLICHAASSTPSQSLDVHFRRVRSR